MRLRTVLLICLGVLSCVFTIDSTQSVKPWATIEVVNQVKKTGTPGPRRTGTRGPGTIRTVISPPPPPYVDAGFPGFPAGTYSWGGECLSLLPMSASAEVPYGGVRGGVGNYQSCCRQDGTCVEMIGGGDPGSPNEANYVDRGGISEFAVELQYGQTQEYGAVVEYETTNYALYSRALDNGVWTGTAAITANTDVGPFGTYLGTNEMHTLTDSSGAASQTWCQTVSGPPTGGSYSLSMWLKAGTLDAARISMVGTGNSAGDRECTITGISTGTYGRRYGCIATGNYTAAMTAIDICIKVGAVDGDTGTIKVSDVQLERDYEWIGVVSSYILTTSAPFTRSRATFIVDYPTTEMPHAEGCMGSGLARERFDGEDYFFLAITGIADQTRVNQFYTPTKILQFDGTNNTLLTVPSIFNGYQYAVSGWSADSGTQTTWMDGGTNSTAFTGSMFASSTSFGFGSTQNGSSNGFVGKVGPIMWGNDINGCRTIPVRDQTPAVLLIGDNLSSHANTNGYINPEAWPDYVSEVYIRNASNNGVQWTHTTGATSGQFARWKFSKMHSTLYTRLAFQAGQNDIIYLGMDGGDLFNEEKTYLERKAKLGIPTYWFNLSPFGEFPDQDGGQYANMKLFNDMWGAYCVSPIAGLKCVDVYTALVVADGGTALDPRYDLGDHISLSDAGNLKVAQTFEAVYP